MIRAIALSALVMVGCGGSTGDVDPWSCRDGVLEVAGPLKEFDARFDVRPGVVVGHNIRPAALVDPRGNGWLRFTLYETAEAGESVTITSWTIDDGEPVCPIAVEVGEL